MTVSSSRRRALVIGGSRGIGAAIAQRLAVDGHDVAITHVSRPDGAQASLDAIRAHGGRALAFQADSSDADALRQAVAAAAQAFGGLDVLVVNAGLYRHTPIGSVDLPTLDQLLAVNIRGVVLAIQAALPHLSGGGRIITIGSNTAVRSGSPGSSLYAMSKAAVAALVRELALELAPSGITINNLQPGPTATDITAGLDEKLAARVPLGRIAQPAEIASLASWVAGPEAGYMTGSSLTIDGGFIL
ncbi:SDR family NAD(P)-dependent oxidoreductase [Stenotrophomonas indicatrix]|jgi:3-oxoacyl-[acyl-carrier protein] reductase|uniref:SDR family oxidoreductase n=1 Tax=Stenotrophomonas indicatrix TaxID=2045451 RepID=A0ABT8QAV5_9GAMM|nr:SDR family oxidoreductase [Stenotrophomonas indicatrix]PJL11998.1 oxidoreductase [Stenotrophomonas maltophilia]MDN8661363.1 SDR family oxidoreductase [Stenotrophomonas indicatrix]MDN8669025.1 SDR family oxidoreductase [Stenotrophomonas indicatrix]PII10910.1 oxidoreductase [Stenotrophomonas indicatrix]PJL21024.1 oxidoreductase [Stenotrophomonas maltophilia]